MSEHHRISQLQNDRDDGQGTIPEAIRKYARSGSSAGTSAWTREIVERTGDTKHLVHRPRAVLDRHDEEVARDARASGLGGDRREPEASRHVAVGEARELGPLAILGEDEDLLLMPIGHEQAVARADSERGDHRPSIEDLGDSLRRDSNDLAGAWAIRPDGQPMLPLTPGEPKQREFAFRAGVNIVMYTLTGNYKADQVHAPALIERLGQ